MPGYMILHYDITNYSKIDKLTKLSLPVNKKFGGKVIIGSPVKTLEGAASSHIVVLEFDSFDLAINYYNSPENQELSILRNQITKGWVTVVPGHSESD